MASQLSTASNVEKAGVQKPCSNGCESDSSTELDLEFGPPENMAIVDKSEKDCRICSINLDTYSHELGAPIVLGCSCNGDLAFAHQKCAEKWFQIKGNKWENYFTLKGWFGFFFFFIFLIISLKFEQDEASDFCLPTLLNKSEELLVFTFLCPSYWG